MLTTIELLNTARRFDGFRSTPFLWGESLEGLVMFAVDEKAISTYPIIDSSTHIRLGKLIEQFVLFELEQDESIDILKSTVQVFHDQRTIGELDCLMKQLEEHIHLEIVYKFYLYDPAISAELNRWIGPNRNDSLFQKMDKLTQKQLPLLYNPETAKILNDLKINSTDFIQRMYFKAQLFVPFNKLDSSFPLVNNNCIKGFYIRQKDLSNFSEHTFFVPTKLDWLIEVHADVEWISVENFERSISELLASQKSPLCWMRSPEGEIWKFFIVWWE